MMPRGGSDDVVATSRSRLSPKSRVMKFKTRDFKDGRLQPSRKSDVTKIDLAKFSCHEIRVSRNPVVTGCAGENFPNS